MPEYIKREVSCKDCICYEMCAYVRANGDGRVLKNSPCKHFKNKADVVEVVRCKDCDHKVDFKGRVMCNRNARKHGDEWYGLMATDGDHFCSCGVAKMDGKGE